ncbi:class I lanthipeptide [Aquimarina spongiae]|uniref:Bacteriocin-type signal sequence-containing protein/natural product n=1 Tax=Aquimarina spongiae TaxID=570521 RepID=A0A1M6IFC4_9FLAO|nr:class I lanthipeptide [Aquimarina spongiae]SHJ33115.1 bacteriocin-type signal sequence-containing protein/natural product precursor [Aquimarina spongiae]
MNKLNLNKETISQMDNNEMASVNGGLDICIVSCKRSTRLGKDCCEDPTHLVISIE